MAPFDDDAAFTPGSVTLAGVTYPYRVHVPAGQERGRALPVVLGLHGAGERGTDGVAQTSVGLGRAVRRDPARFPAVVVMPQVPPGAGWAGPAADAALAALDAVQARYNTDPARVYLTGNSMGGNGAWYLAYRHPDRFAAVAPVCGWVSARLRAYASEPVVPPGDGDPFEALAERLRHLPIRIFHGELDATIPVDESRKAYAALKGAGADVGYTEYPGVGHDAWTPTYASDAFTDWLFEQNRT